MDSSNNAIAKRINKELKKRNWSQTVLLKSIIMFKKPNISKGELQAEINKKKGNFSTTLKGNSNRSIPKEDLYIISKKFGLPLEYIWFGDEEKKGFVPRGAQYAAYQDRESEYRAYISNLDYEDQIQSPDDYGFTLFDYFGQYDSINGYKFFIDNYDLHFSYIHYHQLMYFNGNRQPQLCTPDDKDNIQSNNLIRVLIMNDDEKAFKKIYFDNCSLDRFNMANSTYLNKIELFRDDFLEMLLNNEKFLAQCLKITEIKLSKIDSYCEKDNVRRFVEPMFFETLSYALKHHKEYENQLLKMLRFALEYNKSQYEFVKEYLKEHKMEHDDVIISRYSPRFISTYRGISMGNIINVVERTSSENVNQLLNEIEKYAFDMTHIINKQEKENEFIKISTPNNDLFVELHKNALERHIDFIPTMVNLNDALTYFQSYKSRKISFDDVEQIKSIIGYLDKAQSLVSPKANKVLVHGNLKGPVIMTDGKDVTGIAEWQNCYYGSKYDDRASILSNIDYYAFNNNFMEKYKEVFDVLANGFNKEEQIKLLNKAIEIINEKRNLVINNADFDMNRAYALKDMSAKLELFKEIYLK